MVPSFAYSRSMDFRLISFSKYPKDATFRDGDTFKTNIFATKPSQFNYLVM